jgi:hypothetical protein
MSESKGGPLWKGADKEGPLSLWKGEGGGDHGICTRPAHRSEIWAGHYAIPLIVVLIGPLGLVRITFGFVTRKREKSN